VHVEAYVSVLCRDAEFLSRGSGQVGLFLLRFWRDFSSYTFVITIVTIFLSSGILALFCIKYFGVMRTRFFFAGGDEILD